MVKISNSLTQIWTIKEIFVDKARKTQKSQNRCTRDTPQRALWGLYRKWPTIKVGHFLYLSNFRKINFKTLMKIKILDNIFLNADRVAKFLIENENLQRI